MIKSTATIYEVGGEKQDHRTVWKREISVVEIRQTAEDCFIVRIEQHAPDWVDSGHQVEVTVNADELFDYREFQKQALRQHGIFSHIPEVDEFDGASWVHYIKSRLPHYIGGEA